MLLFTRGFINMQILDILTIILVIYAGIISIALFLFAKKLGKAEQELSDIQNMKLIEYKTQVVNGWNHMLKYVDINSRRRTIIVY